MFNDFSITPINDIKREIGETRGPIGIDTETTGLNYSVDTAFGVSIAFGDSSSYFLRNEFYNKEEIPDLLTYIFSLKRPLIFHNSKFDAHMIARTYNIEVPFDLIHDTFTISYLLDNESIHKLKSLACTYISPDADKYEIHLENYRKANNIKNWQLIPAYLMDLYARKDAEYAKNLFLILYPKLHENNKKWYETERQILRIFYKMEKHGILIDVLYLQALKKRIEEQLNIIEKNIRNMVGFPLDVLSDEQIGTILYIKLKLPILKRTPPSNSFPNGQPSVDEQTLKQLAHPLAKLVFEYRKLNKIKGTYILPLLNVDSNNRVHPSWNPLGTITGRTSSQGPNFQNLPDHPIIKRAIICGESITTADYSQIEFRIAAYVAKEKRVIEEYQNNPDADFHRITASAMFNISMEHVLPKQRRLGKDLNFGIIYGEGPHKLSQQLGGTVEEAEVQIGNYFKGFPELKKAINKGKKEKYEQGYIKTIFGRIINVKNARDHAVFNYKIQGCLHPDELILTQNGYIKIKDFSDGIIWTGTNWASAKKLYKGEYQYCTITLKNGMTLKCDMRHKVLIDNYTWCEVPDLTKEMRVFLSFPRPLEFGNLYYINFKSKSSYIWNKKNINFAGNIDSNLIYLLGLFIAEGNNLNRAISYAIHKKEDVLAGKIHQLAKFFNLHYIDSVRKNSNSRCIYIPSTSLSELFTYLGFGKANAHQKVIPSWIFSIPLSQRVLFLKGILDGDGSIANKKLPPTLHLCNESLIKQIQLLSWSVGVRSRINGPYLNSSKKLSYILIFDKQTFSKYLEYPTYNRIIRRSRYEKDNIPQQWAIWLTIQNISDPSYYAIQSRTRGQLKRQQKITCTVSTFISILEKENLQPPFDIYYPMEIKKIDISEIVGPTYTLSVDDSKHQFDAHCIISKNSAIDLLKLSMVKLDNFFNGNLETINSVHDATYEENLPIEYLKDYQSILEDFDFPIPIKVKIERSTRSLADIKEVLLA